MLLEELTPATALDLECAIDPARYMEQCGMVPDDWQQDFLNSLALEIMLLCGRQTGKSTTTALIGSHEAIYHAPSLVLMFAPSERQSKETLRKAKDFVHHTLGEGTLRFMEKKSAVDKESTIWIELVNGSRIIALPGKEENVRCYSGVNLVIFEEAARVRDELYYAVRPMLATSGGHMIALTTPFGKRGWFHKKWDVDDTDCLKIKYTSEECPRIPKAFLEKEKREVPDFWYRQEYLCEFVEPIDSVFTYDQVMGALSDIEPIYPEGEEP
jgi:hypothetical protein